MPPLWRFLLPSSFGLCLFLLPVEVDGKSTIILGVLTDLVKLPLQPWALEIIGGVVCLSALGAVAFQLLRPDWEKSHPALHAFCAVTPAWFAVRLLAASLSLLVYFQVGPEAIWGADTGRITFEASGPSILYILFFACFLMPFLTDFGFMEFFGTLVEKPFTYLFRLPGRASIDATASFVSASMVAMMISISQYHAGHYSAREASVIATNFSIVSLPFCLVMATVAGIDYLFFSWYGVVVFACLSCAAILPRLPPLSRLPEHYYSGEPAPDETRALSGPLLTRALSAAMTRAEAAGTPRQIAQKAWRSSLGLVANVLGTSLLIATTTMVLVRHTPIFDWLSYPLYLLVSAAGMDHAQTAAVAILVGFLDVFAPALLATDLHSESTRFVIAGVAVSQIIYMSDLGALILRSGLPLSLPRLFLLFCMRTLIVLPIFLVAARLML
ncbi:MAG: nucleoside recognition domain-containing protein [Halieaceae bacterium]